MPLQKEKGAIGTSSPVEGDRTHVYVQPYYSLRMDELHRFPPPEASTAVRRGGEEIGERIRGEEKKEVRRREVKRQGDRI